MTSEPFSTTPGERIAAPRRQRSSASKTPTSCAAFFRTVVMPAPGIRARDSRYNNSDIVSRLRPAIERTAPMRLPRLLAYGLVAFSLSAVVGCPRPQLVLYCAQDE